MAPHYGKVELVSGAFIFIVFSSYPKLKTFLGNGTFLHNGLVAVYKKITKRSKAETRQPAFLSIDDRSCRVEHRTPTLFPKVLTTIMVKRKYFSIRKTVENLE